MRCLMRWLIPRDESMSTLCLFLGFLVTGAWSSSTSMSSALRFPFAFFCSFNRDAIAEIPARIEQEIRETAVTLRDSRYKAAGDFDFNGYRRGIAHQTLLQLLGYVITPMQAREFGPLLCSRPRTILLDKCLKLYLLRGTQFLILLQ